MINYRHGVDLLEPLRNLLWCNTNDTMPIAGALWFLTCLFWVDILFFLLYRGITYTSLRWAVILLFVGIGTAIPSLTAIRLPWAMDVAFVGLGIYALGHLAACHKAQLTIWFQSPFTLWLLVAIGTTGLIFVNKTINLRTGSYTLLPLFWLNLCLSIAVIIYATNSLDRLVTVPLVASRQRLYTSVNILKAALCYVGKNSIVYLCLNQLWILVCKKGWALLQLDESPLQAIVVLLVSVTGLSLSAHILTNTRLKVLVGR